MKVKEKIKKQLDAFITRHATGRMEQMRFLAFLAGSATILIGMPLHFLFGWVGFYDPVLRGISIAIWLAGLAVVGLYVAGRLTLSTAVLVMAVSCQLLTSFRIVYLSLTVTPGTMALYHELVILNELVSQSNLLFVCMTMVRNAPTAVLTLFLIPLAVAYAINPAVVASQFAVLFVLMMVGLGIYAVVMRIVFSNAARELDDYKHLQASILDMFNMSKEEMIALMQMCRRTDSDQPVGYANVGKLSRHTRNNLILLARYLEQEKSNRLDDLAQTFPMLTPTELDVCRLVLKGMTLKEIAVAMNKKI